MSQSIKSKSTPTTLTDTQLVLLSRAAQHEAGAATLPEKISEKVARRLAATFLQGKLVRRVKAVAGKPVWMQEEKGAVALVITKLGRAAINASEEPDASSAEEDDNVAALSEPPALAELIASPNRAPRDGSKLSQVIALLSRGPGVSIEDLIAATGWLPHTTRAALTGLRKRGYAIERSRADDSAPSVYRIAERVAESQAA